MSKKISLGVAATIALIAMAVTFSLTMVISMNMFNSTVSSVKNKERQYNKLSEIDRFVRANEYFTINEDTLNDTIAAGYVLGINDKYARYYTAKAYSEMQSVASGKLTGIGVAVVNDASSGYARIIRVYDGSPASENGLEVRGFITAINGTSTKTMADTATITSALLGEEGTTTTITYLTPDRQEQTLDLVHTNYNTPTVSYQLTAGTCGYIRIDSFGTSTATEFKTAVDSLKDQGATCYVFDLRDNTGENLNAALVSADYCVPSGLIAQQEDKDGTTTDLRMSDENEITLPMVCLVNGNTAGGAELFANALRKMGGATLVGTTTMGKGVVMSDAQSFSDGSAAYITIGLLLDNEGQSWNDTGLTPDVDAALSADEQSAYYDFTIETDPQISKAVNAAMSLAGQN
ncbi:S41 family peptidase [Subdoligranulum variabile]|uniref:Peptidase, S41 family n=1 Tax=Subdoligranulum variabile DSM 15176 TaxID=411471 RepID=D1PMW5_9FIRM|nr:S41 family peptidase [Subdoligranulum variabile]EFB75900.1 peptidase, S41 family [Subdoligranulum variabile DSM 15176]UWP68566.1 S41 family peptidase [Subdoligranulum variabile]